jgi:P4 family phage/plasmid primase-like protien
MKTTLTTPDTQFLPTTPELIDFAARHCLHALQEEFGTPFLLDKDGLLTRLNQKSLVAFLAEDELIFRECKLCVFYSYDDANGLWRTVSEDRLLHHFDKIIRRLAKAYGFDRNAVATFCTKKTLTYLVELLRGHVERPYIFDGRPMAIHLANGMLRLFGNKYELTEYHPTYFSRNRCPIEFNPAARYPKFQSFLDWALPDKDEQATLQLIAGQWLLGRNVFQRIVVLRGPGGSGKSTYMNIVRHLVGKENCAELRTKHLSERFEMNNYLNKSLLIGADVPAGFLGGDSADSLKKMTGDDLLTVERKYAADTAEIVGNFNIGITSNSRLKVRLDRDEAAWRRRLVIIEFLSAPPARIERDLADSLIKEEAQGILLWMITGAARLLELANAKEDFPLTAKQRGLIDDLLLDSDSLGRFVRECLRKDEGGSVSTSEVVEAYVRHCHARSWVPLLNPEKYLRELIEQSHGICQSHDIQRDGKELRGYRNLKITT